MTHPTVSTVSLTHCVRIAVILIMAAMAGALMLTGAVTAGAALGGAVLTALR